MVPVIHKLDIHKETAARRVLDMQLRSYAVEAEIIGFNEIPPLHDTIHSLSNSGETFLGCFESESLVAVISYKFQDSILDIHRLFVDPEYFRQGYAGRMLQAVESAEVGIGKILVSTGSKNFPAVEFYVSRGFARVGEIEVAPGLLVTQFEKMGSLAASSGDC
jgi:ribosomal protein S18 acetylase RimI-like enzyme